MKANPKFNPFVFDKGLNSKISYIYFDLGIIINKLWDQS